MIPRILTMISRVRSQWGRYNLPRVIPYSSHLTKTSKVHRFTGALRASLTCRITDQRLAPRLWGNSPRCAQWLDRKKNILFLAQRKLISIFCILQAHTAVWAWCPNSSASIGSWPGTSRWIYWPRIDQSFGQKATNISTSADAIHPATMVKPWFYHPFFGGPVPMGASGWGPASTIDQIDRGVLALLGDWAIPEKSTTGIISIQGLENKTWLKLPTWGTYFRHHQSDVYLSLKPQETFKRCPAGWDRTYRFSSVDALVDHHVPQGPHLWAGDTSFFR